MPALTHGLQLLCATSLSAAAEELVSHGTVALVTIPIMPWLPSIGAGLLHPATKLHPVCP